MTEKNFSFDLGKIMDEAFKVAQEFGETFGERMSECCPDPEEMREHFRDKFRWHGHADFYPYYSYPPMNIYLATDKSLVFEIALAGFEEKDVELQYRGDYLVFSAKVPEGGEDDEGVQYFKRRLKLKAVEEQRYYVPEDRFDREKTEARFRSGLLRVVVPPRQGGADQDAIKVRIVSEEEGSGGKPGAKPGKNQGEAS